jgi:hypothetical protein
MTVLLMPMTTVMFSGVNPGAALGPELDPFGIETLTAAGLLVELLLLELEELLIIVELLLVLEEFVLEHAKRQVLLLLIDVEFKPPTRPVVEVEALQYRQEDEEIVEEEDGRVAA